MSEPTRMVPFGLAATQVKAPPAPGFTLDQAAPCAVPSGASRPATTQAAARREGRAPRWLSGRVWWGVNDEGAVVVALSKVLHPRERPAGRACTGPGIAGDPVTHSGHDAPGVRVRATHRREAYNNYHAM